VLRYAADRLLHGEVVAIPTDTVYGLAADPFNLSAVEEIYRVKGRPDERALPILVNSLDQAMLLSREVPRNFLRLAEEFWPGALTLVVDASHRLPLKVTANTGRIALRWPRSEVVARLIEEFDGPLTGTSANLFRFARVYRSGAGLYAIGGPAAVDSGCRRNEVRVALHDCGIARRQVEGVA